MTLLDQESKIDHSPLPLPRFVFLCGTGDGKNELASELMKCNPGGMAFDFEEPLRDATQILFWGGFHPDRLDLLDPTLREGALPGFGFETMKLGSFIKKMETFFIEELGRDAIGRMLKSGLESEGPLEYHDHYIFRDCDWIYNAAPFVASYGPENCLFINLGAIIGIPEWANKSRHIWLPLPSTSDRMKRLRRELES